MNILCCLDDNFVQHTGVMLISLFENNKDQRIAVYVLTEALLEENRMKLASIGDRYGADMFFYTIRPDMLKNFPLRAGDYVSLAAYFRLFVPDILPTTIDKIIYLDGDVIVRKSLKELWEMNIDEYALAAIDETILSNCVGLQYDVAYGYFNSGVMLINLTYWRNHDVTKRAIDYILEYPERIKFWDQDALNGVLYRNEWKRISLKWNLTSLFLSRNFFSNDTYSKVYLKEYNEAVYSPVVVHYTGPLKPWNYVSSDHPYKSDYYKYLVYSPWKEFSPIRNFSVWLRRRAKNVLSFFHLYRSPFVVIEKSKE